MKRLKDIKEKDLLKSVSISALLRPVSMVISLLYTPILLKYLGDEKYGIWTTVLSVMNWLTIFDFGIGGGYRNILSIKILNNDKKAIKEVTATAYKYLSEIVFIIFLIGLVIVRIVNWNSVFNTEVSLRSTVFWILVFTCFNFLFGLTNSILYASQKAEYVPTISVSVQFLNILNAFLLYRKVFFTASENELTNVSFLYFLASAVVNVIALLIVWRMNPNFIPNFKLYNKTYVKSIFSYGFKLFFLQISAVVLFFTDNMIITQLFSPADVTPYSITRSVFNVPNALFSAMLAPFWSKYTQEDSKKNYNWIISIIKKQLMVWAFFSICMVAVGFILNDFYRIWLGCSLDVPASLVITMIILMSSEMFTAIFSNFLNGVSHVNLQLVISVTGAILNIPLSIFFAQNVGLGTTGVCLGTIICQLLGCIFLPLDTINYLRKKKNEA